MNTKEYSKKINIQKIKEKNNSNNKKNQQNYSFLKFTKNFFFKQCLKESDL